MPAATAPPTAWHTLSLEELQRQLQTDNAGLSSAEAQKRLAEHGPNELAAGETISAWAILLAQFKNVLLIILIIATAMSAMLGHGVEAAVIGVIVLFAVLLGFYQEFQAEKAMEALRKMAAPNSIAIRDGEEIELPARDLVPGDLILLAAGNKVPADARLVETHNLQIEEAALTGESVASEKHADPIEAAELPVGDRKNMAYAGTAVTYGRARAVVVGTGMDTEFGRIAGMLHGVQSTRTPLQENLDKVGGTLARAAGVIVVIIVGMGLWRAEEWNVKVFVEMLVFGVALAVAVVPEALPAVVTISLAIGVQRMVKRNALIRHLPAVETLGSTSVICSDKTGTLTKDEMTVRRIFAADQAYDVSGAGYEPKGEFSSNGSPSQLSDATKDLLRGAALCCDAQIVHVEAEKRWHVQGDPTEGALVVAAAKAGLRKPELEAEFPRQDERPFSSETKRMITLHRTPQGLVAFAKGAPEVMLGVCSRIVTEQGEMPLDSAQHEAVSKIAAELAEQALRVLAVARKSADKLSDDEHDFTLLGLLGMIDPPRPEAKEAIRICEAAGIKVVMITGDHPITAKAVAKELGLAKKGRVITGLELDRLEESALERDVEEIEVYARVSPAHKLRVVTALQKRGHVVAMTGDGVNDAPSLKKADIGIAMGITGTDVTKEASDMMLTDDNFASIVAAVDEGRTIYGNIKKYLMYLLSANIGEIGLMAGASIIDGSIPLKAVQILYVNLATDGLPALALAVDPPEDDLMQRPPRPKERGIFTPAVLRLMCIGGAWSALLTLVTYYGSRYYYQTYNELEFEAADGRARTATFIALVLIEFFKAYSFRSDHLSVLHRTFVNKWLNYAVLWELILLVVIVHVPFLQQAFGTQALRWQEWLVIALWAHTILPVLEFAKLLERRGAFGKTELST